MSARFLHCFVCLLLAWLWCAPAGAHEDKVIQFKGNELTGLPKQYLPAELNLKEFRLRIGNREMAFSPLLKSILDQPHDLQVTASWYHERQVLPPYLSIRVQPKKKDFSYQLLFNLDTLELIELSVNLQESGTSSRQLPVALSEDQKQAISKSIRKLK